MTHDLAAAVKSQFAQGLSRVMVLVGTPCGLALLGWLISGVHDLQTRMTAMETYTKIRSEARLQMETEQNERIDIHEVRLNMTFDRLADHNLRLDRLERNPFK